MKKLIAVSAVAALAATALSAEVNFGVWGRTLWNVAANAAYKDGEDYKNAVVTDIHQSWGGAAPRIGLSVSGSSENVGFAFDIHNNGFEFKQGDNAHCWVKPIEQVKIYAGKLDVNALRGDACWGLWDWDRLGAVDKMGSEGWTFADYLDAGGFGISTLINPVEALTLGVAVPVKTDEKSHEVLNGTDEDNKAIDPYLTGTLQDAWLNSAIVAAYNIEGTGTIKAGLKLNSGVGERWFDFNSDGEKDAEETWTGYYKDGKVKDVKTWVQIAAAFDLTAVENLYASLGARINTLDTEAHEVNLFARYNVSEQLAINAAFGTKINQYDAKKQAESTSEGIETGFGFAAGAGVAYALENNVTLEADVRYANNLYMARTSADKSDAFTFGVGATKGLSNGLIGIAFEGTTNGGKKGYSRYTQEKPETFAWEIPVKFQYGF